MNSIETAKEKGKQAATDKRAMRWGMTRFSSSITDNPYDRNMRKHEHVAWHNAFYQQRKLMKRSIM